MKRVMLRGKIHRATVTEANLDYVGSCEIDKDLLDAAGMLPYEQVQIYNINTGHRFETYTIEGKRGSGVINVNGAAARLASKGDLVIIVNFGVIGEEEAVKLEPKVVIVDQYNRISSLEKEIKNQAA